MQITRVSEKTFDLILEGSIDGISANEAAPLIKSDSKALNTRVRELATTTAAVNIATAQAPVPDERIYFGFKKTTLCSVRLCAEPA